MQLFSREAAKRLFPNQRLQRWCFDVELVYLAAKAKVHVTEVSVNWTEIAGLPCPWHCSPLAYLHTGMSKSNLAAELDKPVDGHHLYGCFDCLLLAGGST